MLAIDLDRNKYVYRLPRLNWDSQAWTDLRSIGNAKEAGMAEALHLSSSDYSLAVSIFFIGYLLLEVPSNMVLSRTRPSLYLPGLMVRRFFNIHWAIACLTIHRSFGAEWCKFLYHTSKNDYVQKITNLAKGLHMLVSAPRNI